LVLLHQVLLLVLPAALALPRCLLLALPLLLMLPLKYLPQDPVDLLKKFLLRGLLLALLVGQLVDLLLYRADRDRKLLPRGQVEPPPIWPPSPRLLDHLLFLPRRQVVDPLLWVSRRDLHLCPEEDRLAPEDLPVLALRRPLLRHQ
jgi:hypothetical protein